MRLCGEFGLLDLLVEVGERKQRKRLVRHEVERKLQIDQPEIFAAAAAERGAEAVKHLVGTGLRIVDQLRDVASFLEFLHGLGDQRMARQLRVEGLIDLHRLVLLAVPRQPGPVGLHQAERGGIELRRTLKALTGLLLVA